jgi:hypothetical protein
MTEWVPVLDLSCHLNFFFSPFFWADTFKRYLLLVQTSLKKKSRQKIWFLFFVNLLQNLNTFQVMTVVGTSLISVSSKSTLDVHRPFSQKSNRWKKKNFLFIYFLTKQKNWFEIISHAFTRYVFRTRSTVPPSAVYIREKSRRSFHFFLLLFFLVDGTM